jgi:hypothetical protein
MRIGKFTNYHYVVYWNLFAEDHQEFFATLAGELDETVFNESSHSIADSAASSAKKKRRNNDILLNAFETSTVTDKKRILMEEERNALLKEQVAVAQKQAAIVQKVWNAEKLHKLTQDQSILRQQLHSNLTLLDVRCGSSREVKRRMKAHQMRKAARPADYDGSSSEESNASILDEMEDISKRLKRIQEDILQQYNNNEKTL